MGADGLRLWVALYGSEGDKAKIGPEVLQEVEKKLIQIRTSLRFLLGSVDGFQKSGQPSARFIDRVSLVCTEICHHLMLGWYVCHSFTQRYPCCFFFEGFE